VKFILIILLGAITVSVKAQIWAVTEKGDTIYVYNDGTWSFDKEERLMGDMSMNYLNESISLDTITTAETVSEKAKKKVSSTYGFFDIMYNDNEWKRVPAAQINDEAEFAFEAKNSDIYVAVISEEVEIGTENVYKIAINNIRENLQVEPTIIKSELRNVNGYNVIRGVMSLNLNGLNLIFDSYYYSDERGTVQFTTWTATNLHGKYESRILEMLNGLLVSSRTEDEK
jgi:hypothetical protein